MVIYDYLHTKPDKYNKYKYNVLQLDNNVALLFIPKNDNGQLIFGNKFSMAIGIMHCYIRKSFLNREHCEQISFERYNIDFDLLKDSLKHLNEGLYRIDKKYQLSFNIYNQFIEYNLAQDFLVDLKNSF